MNRFVRFLILGALCAALLILAGQATLAAREALPVQDTVAQQTSSTRINELPPMAPGVVLIGLRADVMVRVGRVGVQASDASLDATFARLGVRDAEPLFPQVRRSLAAVSTDGGIDLSRIYRLRLSPDADVLRAVRELSTDPAVVYAEPDYLAHIIVTPNDPLYSGQWGLAQIDAPAAWDMVTGTADVVIAVIDAGLDVSHPDLASQLWVNPGEIAGNSVDDDSNGYVDDVHGWNLVDGNADLSDNTGHGTQVAGVVAAASDNGTGVAGVCWNCRLMVVKVVQSGGIANYSDIAAGVAYAAQKGAEVINLSLGGYSDSATLQAAVAAASQTAVVVGGAGNDDRSDPFYPAAYDDYVLAVAGTTITDTKVGTSNYGTWVEVSAPGEAITTTFSGGGYGSTSGTSMATPFAAGLAGLLRSQHPDWSANVVRAQIVHTTDSIDGLNPGYAGKLGSGRIDAGAAVTTAAQPLLTVVGYTVNGQTNGRPEPGSTADLYVTLYDDWADAASVQGTLSTSNPNVTILTGTTSFGDIAAYESKANTTAFRFAVSGSVGYNTNLSLTLSVAASGGYSATIPLNIYTSTGITNVQGTLTTQTWTNDRTYVVVNNVGVGARYTLTIQPGTTVLFAGSYSFSVAGTLIADGTAAQPIRFTRQASSGNWGQIDFLDSSVDATFDGLGDYTGGSILRHTIIEYGQGVHFNTDCSPFIADNTFIHDTAATSGQSASPELRIVNNTSIGAGLQVDAAGLIAGNTVIGAPGVGISAVGVMSVTANRVINSGGTGMAIFGGSFVSGNLLANNSGHGLQVSGGVPTMVSNTAVFNGSAGVYIGWGSPVLHGNNLVARNGQYALRNATTNAIDATGNWWGTTDDAVIQSTIYDGDDEFGLGAVSYGGYLSGPVQDAPAYLTNLTLAPASPIGIQQVTFDLTFSAPMDQSINPAAAFYSARRGTWTVYNTSNSSLPGDYVFAIAIDSDGAKWFGTQDGGAARFDGTAWTIYNSSNSGLPGDYVFAIAIDNHGAKWFGTPGLGAARFDGTTWVIYNPFNSGLPHNGVRSIVIDNDGAKWFGTEGGGVARFDDTTWTVYNTSNSALPSNRVWAIAIDSDGARWFGTLGGGVARFDGTTWTVYNTFNSSLPDNYVYAIAIDSDGAKWFGTDGGGVARFDDTTWTVYNTSNSSLPGDYIYAIAIDSDGAKWFGTQNGGAARFDGTAWTVHNTSNSGLPYDAIWSITIDDDGNKWFGTLVQPQIR